MILRPKSSWEGSLKWERKVLGGEESTGIERNEIWIAWALFIDSHNSWQIERCKEVSSFKGMKRYNYWEAIQRCPQQKKSSMDRGAIEQLSRRQKLSQWIEDLSRSYQDCDKKKLKSSIDSLSVKSYREAIEIAIRKSLRSSIDSKVSRRCQASS